MILTKVLVEADRAGLFAAALRHRDQFRGTSVADLRAWLRAILLNELAGFRRRFGTAARKVAVGSVSEPAETSPPAVDRLIRDERSDQLSARLAALPDNLRLAVALRLGEGVLFAAVGEPLGRFEEAARKLFARALDRLRGATTPTD